MKTRQMSKVLAMTLVVIMLVGMVPVTAFAGSYDDSNGGTDYYNLISERNWDIAPGVTEYEHVLNNDEGTRRQVLHSAVVDLNNPYVKVIPGYKGMIPTEGNYGIQSTSTQALEAEKLGYGNVVVATNAMLSWYTEAYYKQNPHLIGEPLYYSILDGYYYENSRGSASFNRNYAVLVTNYDTHPLTGEPRPADMPKVVMRSQTDPLTGWEQNAISVWAFLVKPDANGNPVSQYPTPDHGSGIASRTFIGIRADGTLVMAVSDGEQAPYSTGFTMHEMADYMIKMGCIYAANCDGGGSTTFCSQRPGEDLKVNCSLSDGGERPTTNTLLVISTAPADGVFAQATITSDYDYYTPGSTVTFDVLGTDAVGTKVEIPSDVEWALKDASMGTVENGVFKSNGTEGKVTVQMLYNGEVVGERSFIIATPDKLFFDQPVVTVPFGKTAKIPVKATANIGGVDFEIGLGSGDVTFTTTNDALGTFDGLDFIAVDEEHAPVDLTSTVTATLNMGANPSATVQLNLGKGSEVLWGFEGGQADIDIWNVVNNRKNAAHWDYQLKLSLADRENGKVHDGDYSLRLETNGLSSKDSSAEQYAWIRLGVDGEAIVLENARSVGFWLYVPEDNIQCWVQGHYKTDSNGDGIFDTDNVVSMMESENVYYNIDESGWHYLSMDISAFSKIALAADKKYDKDPSDGMKGETGEFFLAIVFHKATNNMLWSENGSINGNYTYYLDNFTVDYSDAVDDRENPVFDKIYLDGTTALVKRDVITTANNTLNLSAAVADQTTRLDANKNEVPLYNASGLNASTAKVYIDGVEVDCTFDGSKIVSDGNVVADGYHRVKFEICDNAGNKSVVIRVVKVESGEASSTIKVVPDDPTLDRIPFGSIYWMNLEATAIETIQSVQTVIDLNNVNHWQLDNMYLADGFSAEYTIAEETNTATITITRTGDNVQTGAAVLAKLPVRMLYFDTDIKTSGYTAATYWTSYPFWAQDLKMDVDMGLITYTNGKTSTFSNEEFHVDSEMFTDRPHMAQVDFAYLNNHGTTHVHTPAAIDDKAPTCAQPGYTGRTFCAGCNSVVDWGTTVPATGHTFTVDVANRKIVCECGHEYAGSGLHVIDGKTYYTVSGHLSRNWIGIDDDWYYFDPVTFEGLDGVQTADQGVAFIFENGRVTKGTWVATEKGTRYWYGPGYYRDSSPEARSCRPYEIDGKTYLFSQSGYMQTGVVMYCHTYTAGITSEIYYYDCGTDGVAKLLNGIHEDYYYEDGVRQVGYRLFTIDGDIYFLNGHKIAKNQEVYLGEKFVAGITFPDGRVMEPGKYEFDAEGKMMIPEMLHGIVDDCLYINGVLQKAFCLVEFEGSFYFVNDGNNKIAKNVELYLGEKFVAGKTFPDGRVMEPGTYEFDAEGKMVIPAFLNGVVDDCVYINGVLQKAYQLVEVNGNFYFINDANNNIAKDTELYLGEKFVAGKFFPDGRAIEPGIYEFDAEGKMMIPEILNGVVDDRLYIDGELQKAFCLVEFEGNFYFVNDGNNKIAKNTKLYLGEKFVDGKFFPDGRVMEPGTYEFDAEGKMVIPAFLNGVVDDCVYINGVLQKAYQLVEVNGNFYFINDANNKIAKDTELYLGEKFVAGKFFPDGRAIEPGIYEFDAEGKMMIPEILNGVVDDRLYIDGELQKAFCLVEFEGNFYFVNDGNNKIAKNTKLYLGEKFVDGKFFPDGRAIEPGTYEFDAEGKMIIPALIDGIVDDRVYIGGVLQKAFQLVEVNGNFYFVNDTNNKIAKNTTLYLSEKFVSGKFFPDGRAIEAGIYEFDAEGKMIVPEIQNGIVDDRLYIDGVLQKAFRLVKFEGNFYFVNDGDNKIAKNTELYLSEKFVENFYLEDGTALKPGYYTFDAEGKMILD